MIRTTLAALCILVTGCADSLSSSPVVDAGANAPLEGVVVRLALADAEPIQVSLAGAWLEEGGDGEGIDAKAVVPVVPPLEVTASRSRWRLADQVVVFEGQVVATRGSVRLLTDRLELTYVGERVRDAVATGHVVVSSEDRRVTADRAVLTVDDGKIVLTGEPRMTQGPNVMTGERIVVFLDDDEVVCDVCALMVSGDAVEPLR